MRRICFLLALLFLSYTIVAQVGYTDNDSLSTSSPLDGCAGTLVIILDPTDQSKCPSDTAFFIARAGGATMLQWEKSIDGGITWTLIPGSTQNWVGIHPENDTLVVLNVDTSMNKYKYRAYYRTDCSLTNYSQPATLFVSPLTILWNGNASNLWSNTANWNCGNLPNTYTNVIINSGTVVVDVNTIINSLKIKTGVNFSVAPGVTLTILH